MGTLSTLGYDPSAPISQFEGNHAETLSTKTLSGCKYPATEVVIRRTKPAAANDNSYVDETHIYLIPANSKYAYDLCFTSPLVGKKAEEIAKSITIRADRIRMQEIAWQWALAVQSRDGKAQYALLGSQLQKKVYNYYRNCGWVTGVSSPWVDSFTVTADDRTVEVNYTYKTSTGIAGTGRQTLTFEQENGQWKISGLSDLADYIQ